MVVLCCLLALGALIAALQKEPQPTTSSPTGIVIRAILSPFQAAIHGVQSAGRSIKRNSRARHRVMRENDRLRKEVIFLTKESARLRGEHAENIRVKELLGFKETYPKKLIPSRIIGRGASQWAETCTIDRGWRHGVAKGDPLITPRGVAGQVIDVGAGVSQALLLTDQSSGVGALVQRSRVTGICQGQQTGSLCMNYLSKDADIKVGDLIVTSGIGGMFPKDLVLGRVTKIRGASGFMKSADVRPSVEFDKLEEAFVVVRKREQ